MAQVLLLHHVQGLTPGVVAFADQLRAAGHTVETPDLFGGRTFDTLAEGMAHVEELGFENVIERGARTADALPRRTVYLGFSLGAAPAQKLAQTRPGAVGALLLHSCVPASFFGPWPAGVPVQVHAMAGDAVFTDDGDLEAAQALVTEADDAELFLYPGSEHLFTDSSLPAYDADATAQVTERVLDFLGRADLKAAG